MDVTWLILFKSELTSEEDPLAYYTLLNPLIKFALQKRSWKNSNACVLFTTGVLTGIPVFIFSTCLPVVNIQFGKNNILDTDCNS